MAKDVHKDKTSKEIHKNHRARMRKKFLNTKFKDFYDHEKLELLLFYAIPVKDTNKIAHELLNKFKTIGGVFDATIDQLMSVDGVGENTALLFKIILEMMKDYSLPRQKRISYDDSELLCDYFSKQFIGEQNEIVKAVCFDDKLRIIECSDISEGDISSAQINIKDLVKFAIKNNSDTIAIAHNHPNGDVNPSDDDLQTTKIIYKRLNGIGIELIDHIVVAKGQAVSFRNAGFFNLLM